MKTIFSDRLERERVAHGDYASARGDTFGAFHLRTNEGAAIYAIASSGMAEVPWEHVSASLRDRCPTWAEMCWVKDLFWGLEETVIQIHPPASEYVDGRWSPRAANCLHLWRPWAVEIPLPPRIAVGPKDEEEARAMGVLR